MTATKRRTDRREPLETIRTVTYLKDAGTPWVEVYSALSDAGDGTTYDVRFEPRITLWTCNCLARVTCKHIRRADRLRRIRFFSVLFAGQPRAVLLAERDRRQERVEAGWADADDYAALDFCNLRLEGTVAA